ncbi:hypothetical protein SAMN05421748_114119 [Paractinoplanes atraurantiacus]|uniref:Uncharacterized protein n=1 Tax=Paractinoplanes atraurantiacus TaxID=1036182 RepID=A0A285J028_9ACTN|nr:hypothetical protein SAMN05421748_114119 [Actinoplanes atraurantiacus]
MGLVPFGRVGRAVQDGSQQRAADPYEVAEHGHQPGPLGRCKVFRDEPEAMGGRGQLGHPVLLGRGHQQQEPPGGGRESRGVGKHAGGQSPGHRQRLVRRDVAGPRELPQRQRVALCGVDDPGPRRLRQRGHQLSGRLGRQRAQCYRNGRPVRFVVGHRTGGHQQDRDVTEAAGQEGQHPGGRRPGPVQVVDEQDHRPPPGLGPQEGENREAGRWGRVGDRP